MEANAFAAVLDANPQLQYRKRGGAHTCEIDMNARLKRTGLVALLITALAYQPLPSAYAAQPQSAAAAAGDELGRQAVILFKLKEFEKAAQFFMRAYGKSRKPALVFNAARAYEEAGKRGDAAALFRLYVSISDDPDGMVDARTHLKALEAAGIAPVQAPTVPTSAPSPPVEPEPAPQPEPPRETSAPKPQPAEPSSGPTVPPLVVPQAAVAVSAAPIAAVTGERTGASRTRAWVAGGSAVVAMVAGGLLMRAGRQDAEAANAMSVGGEADILRYDSQFDSGQRQWSAGVGLTVVAAAAVGLAAWWWGQDEHGPANLDVPVSSIATNRHLPGGQ